MNDTAHRTVTTESRMTQLTQAQKDRWLTEHIPHRVRSLHAISDLARAHLGVQPTQPNHSDPRYQRALTDAIWEGRLVALRWLIEFVGVKKNGRNGRPQCSKPSRSTDVRIDCFDVKDALFPLDDKKKDDAQCLADAWEACSARSSHATEGANVPLIQNAERERAARIVIDHLGGTIYQDDPDWIKSLVF